MTFTKVNTVPKAKRKNNLVEFLDSFMDTSVKVAEVNYLEHEYVNKYSCVNTIRACCVRNGYPITTTIRNGKIYMERRDI